MSDYKADHDRLTRLIDAGYLAQNGEPLCCTNCECETIHQRTTDTINMQACEVEAYCVDCKAILGYWACGSWEWATWL